MKIDTIMTCGAIQLSTPLLTGSGTFGYGDEFENVIDYKSFGGIVTKSISFEPRSGNKPPRICETTTGGIINSIGLANPGILGFLAEKVRSLPIDKTRVFLSVVGDAVEDYVSVIERLEGVKGISGYEINVSCPNVKKGGLNLGGDQGAVAEIVREVRNKTNRFISVKLTPHYPVIAPIVKAAAEAGTDALTLTNTLVGMAIDLESQKPLLGNVFGGYSGPPLKPVALAKVWQAAQVVDIPIWASGGIINGNDCIEFLLAGASGLQLGSVLFADPHSPERVLQEIKAYCIRHDVDSISDLVGKLKV